MVMMSIECKPTKTRRFVGNTVSTQIWEILAWPHVMATAGRIEPVVWCNNSSTVSRNVCPARRSVDTKPGDCSRCRMSAVDVGAGGV